MQILLNPPVFDPFPIYSSVSSTVEFIRTALSALVSVLSEHWRQSEDLFPALSTYADLILSPPVFDPFHIPEYVPGFAG